MDDIIVIVSVASNENSLTEIAFSINFHPFDALHINYLLQ